MELTMFESLDVGTVVTLIVGVGVIYGKIVRLETQVCSIKNDLKEFKQVCRRIIIKEQD